jgi:hypothetical protein
MCRRQTPPRETRQLRGEGGATVSLEGCAQQLTIEYELPFEVALEEVKKVTAKIFSSAFRKGARA